MSHSQEQAAQLTKRSALRTFTLLGLYHMDYTDLGNYSWTLRKLLEDLYSLWHNGDKQSAHIVGQALDNVHRMISTPKVR